MKKLKCKKCYGNWYYDVTLPNIYNDLDGPIYSLYDENKNFVLDFPFYGDMKTYVEEGIVIA